MPSDDLLLYFPAGPDALAEHWQVDGTVTTSVPAEHWLQNMDRQPSPASNRCWPIPMAPSQMKRWWVYWRVFFMACAQSYGATPGDASGSFRITYSKSRPASAAARRGRLHCWRNGVSATRGAKKAGARPQSADARLSTACSAADLCLTPVPASTTPPTTTPTVAPASTAAPRSEPATPAGSACPRARSKSQVYLSGVPHGFRHQALRPRPVPWPSAQLQVTEQLDGRDGMERW